MQDFKNLTVWQTLRKAVAAGEIVNVVVSWTWPWVPPAQRRLRRSSKAAANIAARPAVTPVIAES